MTLPVIISVLGLASSIVYQAYSTIQQASAIKLQASAIQRQLQETRFSTTMSMLQHFSESGRRVEAAQAAAQKARASNDKIALASADRSKEFELSGLLFTVDTYLANLESLSIDLDAARQLADGTLRLLAGAFRANGQQTVAETWRGMGYSSAAARLDELELARGG